MALLAFARAVPPLLSGLCAQALRRPLAARAVPRYASAAAGLPAAARPAAETARLYNALPFVNRYAEATAGLLGRGA